MHLTLSQHLAIHTAYKDGTTVVSEIETSENVADRISSALELMDAITGDGGKIFGVDRLDFMVRSIVNVTKEMAKEWVNANWGEIPPQWVCDALDWDRNEIIEEQAREAKTHERHLAGLKHTYETGEAAA